MVVGQKACGTVTVGGGAYSSTWNPFLVLTKVWSTWSACDDWTMGISWRNNSYTPHQQASECAWFSSPVSRDPKRPKQTRLYFTSVKIPPTLKLKLTPSFRSRNDRHTGRLLWEIWRYAKRLWYTVKTCLITSPSLRPFRLDPEFCPTWLCDT